MHAAWNVLASVQYLVVQYLQLMLKICIGSVTVFGSFSGNLQLLQTSLNVVPFL